MRNTTKRRIVLASASPRRKELLALICPDYEVIPSEFDESLMPDDLSPSEHVTKSASEKAREVAARVGEALVIGSDTVVAVDEHILGKPKDDADAARMLGMLSGRAHQVYTGVCVIDTRDGREECASESTDVRFRALDDALIVRYVMTGEPSDKAGAYAIQGLGSVLIEGITGDYFNVVGLPVYRLGRILEDFGLEALSGR